MQGVNTNRLLWKKIGMVFWSHLGLTLVTRANPHRSYLVSMVTTVTLFLVVSAKRVIMPRQGIMREVTFFFSNDHKKV